MVWKFSKYKTELFAIYKIKKFKKINNVKFTLSLLTYYIWKKSLKIKLTKLK